MKRIDAITLICNWKLKNLTYERREQLIFDWWGIDGGDIEIQQLEDSLKEEILTSDEPIYDIRNQRYNSLILCALKYEYIGVKNEYLENEILSILGYSVDIEGEEEKLYKCSCCLYHTIKKRGQYEICPVCHWEDDGNNDTEKYSEVNHMTISEGRKKYKEYITLLLKEENVSDKREKYIK